MSSFLGARVAKRGQHLEHEYRLKGLVVLRLCNGIFLDSDSDSEKKKPKKKKTFFKSRCGAPGIISLQ